MKRGTSLAPMTGTICGPKCANFLIAPAGRMRRVSASWAAADRIFKNLSECAAVGGGSNKTGMGRDSIDRACAFSLPCSSKGRNGNFAPMSTTVEMNSRP